MLELLLLLVYFLVPYPDVLMRRERLQQCDEYQKENLHCEVVWYGWWVVHEMQWEKGGIGSKQLSVEDRHSKSTYLFQLILQDQSLPIQSEQ